ncbi:hypothetical protein ICF26_001595 [Campylobacter jejuni]|nr:hypothetical protein [Campylobacter jejuni]EGX8973991.1 hypothetical protein [Campylobacter jejuni]
MKKITKNTLKSFINKNKDNLEIKVSQKFNGLDDSLNNLENEFKNTTLLNKIGFFKKYLKYYKDSNSYFSLLSKEDKIKDFNNIYRLVFNCKHLCENLGFNFYQCMLQTIKEIESRKGYYDENLNKFIKDTSDEAKAKWYKADYESCRL